MPAASFDSFYQESWIPCVPAARLAPSTGPRSVIGPFQQDRAGARGTTLNRRRKPCKLHSAVILFYGHRLYGFTYDRRHSSGHSPWLDSSTAKNEPRFIGFSTFMEHFYGPLLVIDAGDLLGVILVFGDLGSWTVVCQI